jgi:hypothetical protein
LEPTSVVGILTGLICTAALVWAIHGAGAVRAARFRCRAEAYEEALAFLMRASNRPPNLAEWPRIRARVLLWGNNAVVRELLNLGDDAVGLDLKEPETWAQIITLIRAMRSHLGHGVAEYSPQVPASESQTDNDED